MNQLVVRIAVEDEARAARLLRVGRRLAVLRHPNIAPVGTLERKGDEVLVFAELLDAEPLDDLLDAAIAARRALPLTLRLRALIDVLRGLAVLHSLRDASGGLNHAHGHVCPSRVLVGTDGNARVAHPVAVPDPRPTRYTAPELQRGYAPDARADVYSCGVMLWEALGRHPFDPARAASPPVPKHDTWAIPLAVVAARAVSSNPVARYATIEDLAMDVITFAYPYLAPRPTLAAAVAKLCGARISGRRRALAATLARANDDTIPVVDASLDDEPTLVFPAATPPPAPAGPPPRPSRLRVFPLVIGFLGTSALLFGTAYVSGWLP